MAIFRSVSDYPQRRESTLNERTLPLLGLFIEAFTLYKTVV